MGSTDLLIGHDLEVAQWCASRYNYCFTMPDYAIGVVRDGVVIGAALFHAHNGPDVEFSYYGHMTLDAAKQLARFAVGTIGVVRLTARTAKNNKIITRKIKKIGFEFEGVRKHGYGEHDAVMYGLYGKKLHRFIGVLH